MNYIKFDFDTADSSQSDHLLALLSQQNFEGFEEEDNSLKAFVRENLFDEKAFEEIVEVFPEIAYTRSLVENINWNQQWESGFDPVMVDDFVAVRAGFHAPVSNVQYEIIITPKMSFGTGHHATTYLMMQQMRQIDFKGKSVLDFGTGTGVLAILAKKLGAGNILAIDYDEWSITNTKENINQNGTLDIEVQEKDAIPLGTHYDIILANINLNVILDNIASMKVIAHENSILLLSGLLTENESEVLNALKINDFDYLSTSQKGDWIAILAKKRLF